MASTPLPAGLSVRPSIGANGTRILTIYWQWWLGELSAVWSKLLGQRNARSVVRHAVLLGDHTCTLLESKDGSLTPLQEVELAAAVTDEQRRALAALFSRCVALQGQVNLAIPDDQVLKRMLDLPLAAEEDLETVLGFEMDRVTPFKADQVCFAWRVAERNSDQGKIRIELHAVRKEWLAGLLHRMQHLVGSQPQAASAASEYSKAPDNALNLLRAISKRAPAKPYLSFLNAGLALLLLGLLMTALLLPAWNLRTQAKLLQPLVAAAKVDSDAVATLRDQLDQLVADNNFLMSRKHSAPASIVLIDELSRALPDTTWLQSLEIKSTGKTREVLLTGETASYAKLIEAIEQAGSLQNTTSRSQLVRGATPNSERFVIAADIKPRALPPAVPDSELAAPSSPVSTPGSSVASPADAPPSPAQAPDTRPNLLNLPAAATQTDTKNAVTKPDAKVEKTK